MKKGYEYITLIILVMFIVLLQAENIFAQAAAITKYKTIAGSKIWFDGTSTLSSFTFTTSQVEGTGYVGKHFAHQNSYVGDTSGKADKVSVLIPVRSFDSGNEAMNNDMYHAMKSKEYPLIHYSLITAKLLSLPDSSKEWFKLDTKGIMTIAGKSNIIDIVMKVKALQNGEFLLVGSKPISMHDYDIVPPSAFFGLIRAHDKLIVHFNLIAKAEKVTYDQGLNETVLKDNNNFR